MPLSSIDRILLWNRRWNFFLRIKKRLPIQRYPSIPSMTLITKEVCPCKSYSDSLRPLRSPRPSSQQTHNRRTQHSRPLHLSVDGRSLPPRRRQTGGGNTEPNRPKLRIDGRLLRSRPRATRDHSQCVDGEGRAIDTSAADDAKRV